MLTTIAILLVGCFVVYAVVRALAFFTGGTRPTPAIAAFVPQRRVGRRVRP